MIIPWLVTKMKGMMHLDPLDHKMDEDYDDYGHHDNPKVYNKDEDHP